MMRGSPADVRSSPENRASTTAGGLPGFHKSRWGSHHGQHQGQNGSGSISAGDSVPRVLHTGGGDGTRTRSDASHPHDAHHQQRRQWSSGDESRRRESTSMSADLMWDLREPAQPHMSSPVAHSPSVKQRQRGLNIMKSRGAGGGGHLSGEAQPINQRDFATGQGMAGGCRVVPPGQRESGATQGGMASFDGGGIGGGSGREAMRDIACNNSIFGTTGGRTVPAERGSGSSSRRGSGIGGNNQAEETRSSGSTPRRLSASAGRSVSYSSGSGSSPNESGLPLAGLKSSGHSGSSRGGRTQRRGERYENSESGVAYNTRRQSGDAANGARHRDGYYHYMRGGSDGDTRDRASPFAAPPTSGTTELDRRFPSIESLDLNSPTDIQPWGGVDVGRGVEERCKASSLLASAKERRDRDPKGNGSRGAAPFPSGSKASSRSNSGISSREEGGGKEQSACAGGLTRSGGGRLDYAGHSSAGGRAAPGGDRNSGGEVALPAPRSGSSSGGASLGTSGETVAAAVVRKNSTSYAAAGAGSSKSVRSSRKSGSSTECLVGLQNLGNTCFMNASLQCLLHTDVLVALFRGLRGHDEQRLRDHNNSPTRGALAEAFSELAASVEALPAHANVSPAQVKRLIGKYAPHLSGYGQQDCQEFLRFFLDGLSEDLNRRRGAAQRQGNQGATKRTSLQQTETFPGRRGGEDQQKRASSTSPPAVPDLSDEDISRLSAEQLADRAWALHLARNDSEITGMFCGQLQSRISCLSCGNVSYCFDPFFDLSVPLPGGGGGGGAAAAASAVVGGGRGRDEGSGYGGRRGSESTSGASRPAITLEDCLRAFSTEEKLDGDNKPVCDQCRKRRTSTKCLAVHRFPPVLVIHLKRFQYNSTSRTKLSTTVEFPIGSTLDLTPYCTSATRPSSCGGIGSAEDDADSDCHRRDNRSCSRAGANSSSGLKTGRSNSSSGSSGGGGGFDHRKRFASPIYELYAVCNHMGGLQGGHYTAHCRNMSGGNASGGVSAGEWHTFDDAQVSPVSSSRVGGASAYVLFYRLKRSQ